MVRRKKRRRKAKTISEKQLSRHDIILGAEILKEIENLRPRTRGECKYGIRPCPFVSCKYHLYLDINPVTKTIKLNFPDLEVWELPFTCALDLAEAGGLTLEKIGEILNLTRERIRQMESTIVAKLHEILNEEDKTEI